MFRAALRTKFLTGAKPEDVASDMTANDKLYVEVLDDEIIITLPGTSYAVTYYRGYSFPSAASHQVPLGRRGSRCPNDASRVSRSRLEACQPQGARARLDCVTQISGSPGVRETGASL